jgi:hypothetical protein
MRPENDFLLSCVGVAFGKNGGDPPPVLPEALDWKRFVGLCDWHNLVPLAYRVLPAVCPGEIPSGVTTLLRGLCHVNTARTLSLVSELDRILKAFESCGVPAYPFKGPALSVMLYGDPARRKSKDLDILVPRAKLRRAMGVLDELGYDAKNAVNGVRLAAHRCTEYEMAFFRRDGKLTLELQWALVPAFFGFDHERLGLWAILEEHAWNGFSFPVLPPEETLLMLSVHGAKHLWCKLGWVSDVAGLLTAETPPDLERSFELARQCGATRLLSLALLLAKRLAGVCLPEKISAWIDADLMASRLARQVLSVIAATPVNPDVDPWRYLFYLKARERRRDQFLFTGKLMATLAAGEWNPAPLPDSLFPLSYCFRPLRLMLRHERSWLKGLGSA